MEVILLQDVENVGIKNEVVKVKEGFGRNFLLRQKLAILASTGNRKNLGRQIQKATDLKAKRLTEAKLLAERLSKLSLKISKTAGKEGKLFGSVTPQEVADLIDAAAAVTIDRRKLVLPTHLKTLGAYSIQLRIETGVTAEIRLEVLPDAASEQQPTAAPAEAAPEAPAAEAAQPAEAAGEEEAGA